MDSGLHWLYNNNTYWKDADEGRLFSTRRKLTLPYPLSNPLSLQNSTETSQNTGTRRELDQWPTTYQGLSLPSFHTLLITSLQIRLRSLDINLIPFIDIFYYFFTFCYSFLLPINIGSTRTTFLSFGTLLLALCDSGPTTWEHNHNTTRLWGRQDLLLLLLTLACLWQDTSYYRLISKLALLDTLTEDIAVIVSLSNTFSDVVTSRLLVWTHGWLFYNSWLMVPGSNNALLTLVVDDWRLLHSWRLFYGWWLPRGWCFKLHDWWFPHGWRLPHGVLFEVRRDWQTIAYSLPAYHTSWLMWTCPGSNYYLPV